MCKVGVRTCIFLCCFGFFSHCEKKTEEGLAENFSCAFCFSYPGHHSCLSVSVCELVASLLPQISPEHPQCVPSHLSLGRAVRPRRAWVPQPDGFLCLPGTFQAAEGPGEASSRGGTDVGMRKCSRSSTMWWSQFMLSSSVLRNILHLKSSGSPRAIFGAALGSSARGCQHFPAALVSPSGLGCLPSPCSGPLRAQHGGHLPCPCPGDAGKGTENKGKTTKGRTPPVGSFRVYFQFPVCLPYRKVNWLLLILQ